MLKRPRPSTLPADHRHRVAAVVRGVTAPEASRRCAPRRDAGVHRAHLGFMQSAHVPKLLERRRTARAPCPVDEDVTYYLGRNALVIGDVPRMMWGWRKRVFASLMRNAAAPTRFFGLPPGRTIEIGAQYEL